MYFTKRPRGSKEQMILNFNKTLQFLIRNIGYLTVQDLSTLSDTFYEIFLPSLDKISRNKLSTSVQLSLSQKTIISPDCHFSFSKVFFQVGTRNKLLQSSSNYPFPTSQYFLSLIFLFINLCTKDIFR